MKVETSIHSVRASIRNAKESGCSIGFVPTMGNLHAGHIQLVKEAKARCDYVVVSIFVNPTQFGENEDLDNYPRTLNEDYEQLLAVNCDLVFVPEVSEMYSHPPQIINMTVGNIANILCGSSRPGHFDGVVTIVTKLFNIIQPEIALFGEKDYQQLAIIRKLTEELHFNIDVLGIPTIREPSGLALSSRNGYLTAAEKETAKLLSQSLQNIGNQLESGNKDYVSLCDTAQQDLLSNGFHVDYLEIRNRDLSEPCTNSTDFVVLVAAKVGSNATRLIDNMQFSEKKD